MLTGFAGVNERLRLRDSALGMTFTHTVNAGDAFVFSGVDGANERGEPHLLTILRTNVDTSIWVDGRERVEFEFGTPEPPPAGDISLTLGADLVAAGGEVLGGEIGEVLIFNGELSLEMRAAVETYLSNK